MHKKQAKHLREELVRLEEQHGEVSLWSDHGESAGRHKRAKLVEIQYKIDEIDQSLGSYTAFRKTLRRRSRVGVENLTRALHMAKGRVRVHVLDGRIIWNSSDRGVLLTPEQAQDRKFCRHIARMCLRSAAMEGR